MEGIFLGTVRYVDVDQYVHLMRTKLTCQRIASEEQRITAWMSDGSAGRATPDKRDINKGCSFTYTGDSRPCCMFCVQATSVGRLSRVVSAQSMPSVNWGDG